MIRMNHNSLILYKSLLKIGTIGFGGGSALIPVFHRYIVDDGQLLSEDEFNKDLTVAISTPGALPVELSVGAGLRKAGQVGFFLAPVMVSLPGVLLSVAILVVLGRINDGLTMQFTLLSMGITAYIMSEILRYIYKTIRSLFHENRPVAVMLQVLPDILLLLKRIASALVVILFFGAVLQFLFHGGGSFSWRACLSSILSFGGGDAYIAIAERMFVASGMLASLTFFSIIIPTVNATPGSILCKSLASIGYCIGTGLTGSMAGGLLWALCGYAFSICMSCVTYAVGSCFLEAITAWKVWKYISLLLRVIISFLQLKILLRLSEGFCDKWEALGWVPILSCSLLLALVVFNVFLPGRWGVRKLYVVLASVALCLVLGNIRCAT